MRGPAPDALADAPAWTAEYVRRRAADPTARFEWRNRANQALLPLLLRMTGEHCAYCDGWPIDETGQPTIDHFRPKHRFPEEAFAWSNLFPACDRCQGRHGKGERRDERLLKPDDAGYEFDHYFVYRASTGELEPNPAAPAEDQERARVTIALFGLNGGGRPAGRRRAARLYAEHAERPYRFVYPR